MSHSPCPLPVQRIEQSEQRPIDMLEFVLDSSESGFAEVMQVFVLAGTALVWARHALHPVAGRSGYAEGWWAAAPSLAALAIAGFSRELSFGAVIGFSDNVVQLSKVITVIVSLSLVCISIYRAIRLNNGIFETAMQIAKTRPMSLMTLGVVLFVLGDLFDKRILGGDQHQIFEEYLELFAYLSLLVAALLVSRSSTHSDRN